MDIRWLEDFLAVVETAHFARAAAQRRITQSALSRRIKSLEVWFGEELLDRSRHPIQPTRAGRDFVNVARGIVDQAYASKAAVRRDSAPLSQHVVFGSLHTLALFELPGLVAKLRTELGHFSTRIVAETRTLDEYITNLEEGGLDLFFAYAHPAIQVDLDPVEFPRMNLKTDRFLPYGPAGMEPPDLGAKSGPKIPFLKYSGTAFMAQITEVVLSDMPSAGRLQTVFEASLAESLYTAAMSGLGMAWLPETIGTRAPATAALRRFDERYSVDLSVCVYRRAAASRPIVEDIWNALARGVSV